MNYCNSFFGNSITTTGNMTIQHCGYNLPAIMGIGIITIIGIMWILYEKKKQGDKK
jgi:hypothetical protein